MFGQNCWEIDGKKRETKKQSHVHVLSTKWTKYVWLSSWKHLKQRSSLVRYPIVIRKDTTSSHISTSIKTFIHCSPCAHRAYILYNFFFVSYFFLSRSFSRIGTDGMFNAIVCCFFLHLLFTFRSLLVVWVYLLICWCFAIPKSSLQNEFTMKFTHSLRLRNSILIIIFVRSFSSNWLNALKCANKPKFWRSLVFFFFWFSSFHRIVHFEFHASIFN